MDQSVVNYLNECQQGARCKTELKAIGPFYFLEMHFPEQWDIPREHYDNLIKRDGSEKSGYILFTDEMKGDRDPKPKTLRLCGVDQDAPFKTLREAESILQTYGMYPPTIKEMSYAYHNLLEGTRHPYIATFNKVIEKLPIGSPRNGTIILPSSYRPAQKNFVVDVGVQPFDKNITLIAAVTVH